jgi:transcriptional regulator with GAF, ATPase, and Fis domain
MSREQLLATTFVELADTLGEEFDVLDFLQNLAGRSVEIIDVASAGVVLADRRGDLQLTATTSHASQVLELFALAISEGPCLQVARTGEEVVNLEADEARSRWPRFTEAARDLGIVSAHVFPMRLRTDVLGALSLFGAEQRRLTEDDVAIARALASVATIGLLRERTPRQRETVARQLGEALQRRVALEQAKGIVAELASTDMETAFGLLMAHGRRTGSHLGDTVQGVVERRLALADLLPQEGEEPGAPRRG